MRLSRCLIWGNDAWTAEWRSVNSYLRGLRMTANLQMALCTFVPGDGSIYPRWFQCVQSRVIDGTHRTLIEGGGVVVRWSAKVTVRNRNTDIWWILHIVRSAYFIIPTRYYRLQFINLKKPFGLWIDGEAWSNQLPSRFSGPLHSRSEKEKKVLTLWCEQTWWRTHGKIF
jgi:hypothetical protein